MFNTQDSEYNKNDSVFSSKLPIIIGICVISILLIWCSFFVVSPGSQGVIFRLGSYNNTVMSGFHFKLPFIDDVYKVNTETVRRGEYGYRTTKEKDKNGSFIYEENEETILESRMLTVDSKIVDIDFVTQFQVSDPVKFIINLPKKEEAKERTIRNITESCFREIVADITLDEILTSGKDIAQFKSRELMQKRFNKIDAGIKIVSIQIQDVDPPGPVQKAFDNVNTAKANKEKRVLEAKRYENEKLADAEGEVQKINNDAKSYSARRTSVVEGDYNRIHQLSAVYKQNPTLVKTTLYLEAAEEFWPKANITIIDTGNTVNFTDLNAFIKKGTVTK